MLRKLIIKPHPATPDATTGEIDIAAVATVLVTSEAPDHPIDLAFDDHRGPGGTRWIAGEPGEQTVTLAFDAPQTINQILLEVEELEVARTQELQLCLSLRWRTDIPGIAATGIQLQPSRNDLRAGEVDSLSPGSDPSTARDQAGQGGQALSGNPHVVGLAVTEPGWWTKPDLRNGTTRLPARCASPSFLSIPSISCYPLVGWSDDRVAPLALPDPVAASPSSYPPNGLQRKPLSSRP